MLKEFKEFAMKGNMVDMAVGIMIGAAFGTIITSLVADILTPIIGVVFGNVDFSNIFVVLKEGLKEAGPYATLAEAKKAGAVTMNIGLFLNALINFCIIAFALFMVVRNINRMRKKEAAKPADPTTKECPHCLMSIPLKATKCGHCTSGV
ncbi:MAG TPA: large conductance mechanosensitive channel protein MscL [Nitrospirota bacterium]